MAMTDIQIRQLKPREKQYKKSAGNNLYLIVTPKGSKRWRVRYRIAGKQYELSVGVYPRVSLKEAGQRRDELLKKVAKDVDPGAERRADKLKRHATSDNSFEAIGREWFDKFSPDWSSSHRSRSQNRLEKDVYPWLGKKPINSITPVELLMVLRDIEGRGAVDTAHRVKQLCGQIFRYAVATGRAERDPSQDLKGALPRTKTKHFASITEPKAIGELLRAISGYNGNAEVRTALKIAPYVFVRPGELRHAEWSEFDFEKSEWRIPAEKMKMGVQHIVPLSEQVVTLLKELKPLTGYDKYLFPSNRTKARPISENTLNAALRRLGYSKDEMTSHGFRSMASTLLNEQGWNHDAIERQLAHAEKNGVRASYNYAEYLPVRKEMMQSWADYLDSLAAGGKVIPINNIA